MQALAIGRDLDGARHPPRRPYHQVDRNCSPRMRHPQSGGIPASVRLGAPAIGKTSIAAPACRNSAAAREAFPRFSLPSEIRATRGTSPAGWRTEIRQSCLDVRRQP